MRGASRAGKKKKNKNSPSDLEERNSTRSGACATHQWVYKAGGAFCLEGVVKAGLVACNAGVDFLCSTTCRLVDKVGVSE